MKLLATALALALAPAVPNAGGDLLVTSWNNGGIYRYDGTSGAFVGVFVTPGSGGLANPHSACFGPDGNLYVTSFANDRVLRYDGTTGAFLDVFVAPGAGGLDGPTSAEFGDDGHLYVSSFHTPGVLRYDGTSGAFLGTFVAPGAGLVNAESGHFGPNGDYYLANSTGNNVLRYDGATGASLGVFASGNGLADTHEAVFGPNGNLFATAFGNRRVNEYDGMTGAFVRTLVPAGNNLNGAHGMLFDGGFLYVASFNSNRVNRYDATTGAFDSTFVTPGLGGLSGPISLTRIATASVTPYGCGVNPAGSLVVSGLPQLGATLTFGVDNPLGTQGVGSTPYLALSFQPQPGFPCGRVVPGYGMASVGAPGELLVRFGTPLVLFVPGPSWQGAGLPSSFQVTVPFDTALIGVDFFAQGAIRDVSLPPNIPWGFTEAHAFTIGS